MSNLSTEKLLNRVSVICMIVGGVFFLYEGGILLDMHRSNPEKVPSKVAVAGTLTILLGVVSLLFAFLHFIFDGTAAAMISKMGKM